jgi:succinoglycan biosynthesis protein ExoV
LKLCYWDGATPNFGDELNPWLWPKLLPDTFDRDETNLFIGIGSILYDDYPAHARKIVFGSGYGGYTPPPIIDDTWTVYFVRGPRTAATLGLDRRYGVGDSATLLATLPEVRALPRGTAGPAFMPHWESAVDGRWERVARIAGLRFIDPRWDVDRVLAEIAASQVLVTEAMHGAIVADALRVPWVPYTPLTNHHFKWHDWAESLGLTVTFSRSLPSSLLEALLRIFDGKRDIQQKLRYYGRMRDLPVCDVLFAKPAARALAQAATTHPHLSSDEAFSRQIDAMLALVQRFREDFRPGITEPVAG